MRAAVMITMCAAALFFGGCVKEVKPWERATLAKPIMKEGGLHSLQKKYEEHIFFSKESSKGGGGVAGGGCGCN